MGREKGVAKTPLIRGVSHLRKSDICAGIHAQIQVRDYFDQYTHNSKKVDLCNFLSYNIIFSFSLN